MKFKLSANDRFFFCLIALLISVFGAQSIAVKAQNAQFESDLYGQAATTLGQNMTSNVIGMNAIKNRGAAKIKAGKATTTFVHSPDIYEYMLDYISFDPGEPESVTGRMKYMQNQVRRFEARMMKAGGYKLHDNRPVAKVAYINKCEASKERCFTKN